MKKVVRFILEFLASVSMAITVGTTVGTTLELQPNLVLILVTSVTTISAYILFQITKE